MWLDRRCAQTMGMLEQRSEEGGGREELLLEEVGYGRHGGTPQHEA